MNFISGNVGGQDEGDYFRFSVAQNSAVQLKLSGLIADIDFRIESLSDPTSPAVIPFRH